MNQGDTVVVMPQHPKKCFEDDKENINPHSGLNQSTSNNIRRGGGNAGTGGGACYAAPPPAGRPGAARARRRRGVPAGA